MSSQEGRVVVAGSINVDFIVGVDRLPVAGESVLGHSFLRQGGGKSANQAVAARRFGADVSLLGAVGDDALGRDALASLSAEGIRTDGCAVIPDEYTGLAMIAVDRAGENQIVVAPGANLRPDREMVRRATAGLAVPSSTVVLVSLEFADEAVAAVMGWAAERGLRAILNPAPARDLSDEMLTGGPILTPNRTEAALLGGSDDPEVAARTLAERTRAPVIVSLGAQGALLWDDGRVVHVPAMVVEPVDTTGAGDALNGILAAELSRGASLEDALRRAVVGAALSTLHSGAQAGMPSREAVAAHPSEGR